jgi:hypothetical protein
MKIKLYHSQTQLDFNNSQYLPQRYPEYDVIVLSRFLIEDITEYAIDYVATLFYPLVTKHKKAICIAVSKTFASNGRISIEYRCTFKEMGSCYTKFYKCTAYFKADDKINKSVMYLYRSDTYQFCSKDILRYWEDKTIRVNEDCEELGFLKAVKNPSYDTNSCESCHYYCESNIVNCAVRPGLSSKCSDYINIREVPSFENKKSL